MRRIRSQLKGAKNNVDFAALVSNAASSSVVIMYIRSQITVNFSFYDEFRNHNIMYMNVHQASIFTET